jgi:hypothetical protein
MKTDLCTPLLHRGVMKGSWFKEQGKGIECGVYETRLKDEPFNK